MPCVQVKVREQFWGIIVHAPCWGRGLSCFCLAEYSRLAGLWASVHFSSFYSQLTVGLLVWKMCITVSNFLLGFQKLNSGYQVCTAKCFSDEPSLQYGHAYLLKPLSFHSAFKSNIQNSFFWLLWNICSIITIFQSPMKHTKTSYSCLH